MNIFSEKQTFLPESEHKIPTILRLVSVSRQVLIEQYETVKTARKVQVTKYCVFFNHVRKPKEEKNFPLGATQERDC